MFFFVINFTISLGTNLINYKYLISGTSAELTSMPNTTTIATIVLLDNHREYTVAYCSKTIIIVLYSSNQTIKKSYLGR